jgi:hypothetical protein
MFTFIAILLCQLHFIAHEKTGQQEISGTLESNKGHERDTIPATPPLLCRHFYLALNIQILFALLQGSYL